MKLLQSENEFVLSRDPHVVSRFVELLEENFIPLPTWENPNFGKASNVGFPDLATHEQEPSVADPTPTSSVTDQQANFSGPDPSSGESSPLTDSGLTLEAGLSSPQQTESEAS